MATATEASSAAKTKQTPKAKPSAQARAAAGTSKSSNREAGRRQIQRTTETADQVLEQVQAGGQSAIDALRRFVNQVDEALPNAGDGPSRGHDIVDSALEMGDRMVEGGADAIRGIVKAAGNSFNKAVK